MISPQVTMALAQAKADDLRRAGDAHRRTQPRAQPRWPVAANRSVTLRFGSPCDDRALARLAALDSAERLALPVLLAEVDGRVVAALALSDGICIADPFYPTADLLDLLRARAAQLEHAPRTMRSGRLRSWSRRRTPAWG
jgi:hypothetical protein